MSDDRCGMASRREFLGASAAAGAFAVAGCTMETDGGANAPGDGGGLSGEVVVTGSSTVFPVSDAMAEAFMGQHPDVNVTVDSTGTGGGFQNQFCPGSAAINGASRPITDSEREHCAENGVEPVEFRIGADALTVVVNENADWVDCVTFGELSRIWRADGAERWSDVRAEWPDEPIELFGPASTSGTYDWFDEHVIGENHEHTSDHEPTEGDNQIVLGVKNDEYAMGYLGYAYYQENSDTVKGLELEETSGDGCTPPSLENAKSGSYPMARPLFIYASEGAVQREAVSQFLEFYLRKAATDLVSDVGYVPVSGSVRDENLSRLEEIRSGG